MEGPNSYLFLGVQHKMSTYSFKKQNDTRFSTKSSQEPTGLNIFEKYNLSKKKNEMLTNKTYAQFWKKKSTTHQRLLSSFDTYNGMMHMVFFQAQVPHPKEVSDYKRETFDFDVKEVHLDDQMDIHRQNGERIFSTLKNTSMVVAKLQVSLYNVRSQLKLDKISSLEKDNKIKSLEELVIKIGYDPSNVKVAEELLNKKNSNIESLRKQLKLPATEDSQTKEMAETEGYKDEMLKLIMDQNAQIKEMEAELDKLVKEKE
jgi:hypothetical protein